MIRNRPGIENGTIEVPDRPGLDLDWDLIAIYRLAR